MHWHACRCIGQRCGVMGAWFKGEQFCLMNEQRCCRVFQANSAGLVRHVSELRLLRSSLSYCAARVPHTLPASLRACAVEAEPEYGRPVRRFRNESYTDSMEASRPRREHRPLSARAAADAASRAARVISTAVVEKLTCSGGGPPSGSRATPSARGPCTGWGASRPRARSSSRSGNLPSPARGARPRRPPRGCGRGPRRTNLCGNQDFTARSC